jgi:hypothetical protein
LAELSENGPRHSKAIGPHGRGIRRRINGWAYAPAVGKFVWPEYDAYGVDIWVWDASTDVSRRLIRKSQTYHNDFVISPDGGQLAASRSREGIRLWPPLNGVLSRYDVDLSFPGGETCVFDAQDGSEVACMPTLHRNKFSPDGNSFAAITRNGDVAIYDAPFRKPYGQRVTIGFTVGVLVFLFLNFVESTAFRAARGVFSRSLRVRQLFDRPGHAGVRPH